ncbi:MAG: CehA/McbA family metallohydrolase [Dehalococcoidia bacterium]
MLIDLHCHTLPRSTCSQLQPDALIDAARSRGLDGICLTEHDRWWPEDELRALRRRTGFLILSGVELTTDMGHVLAFGLPESAASAVGAELAARAADHGALLFLAHPARDNLLRLNRQTIDTFASVEAVNGSDSRLKNMAATGIARAFRLPGIGGSDAHTLAEVGRAATRFHDPATDHASLLTALRAGRYEAVALAHDSPSPAKSGEAESLPGG